MKKLRPAQILLEKHLGELGIRNVEVEYRFCKDRLWRADYYIPEWRILLEIEGGLYIRGRHSRGAGMEEDILKYDTATMLGFRVLRFSTGQILSGTARQFLKLWLTS